MPNKLPNKPTVEELMTAGCERNIPVEIHKHTGNAAIPVARARMMCTDDERLYLDEPQTIGKEVKMGKGTNVDVYCSIGEQLYTFTTSVASMQCKVRLNASKTLVGMALNLPSKVEQGQRRSRFRTSLAMCAPIMMTMHQASPDLNSSPIDAGKFRGRLVDASDGGIGVMLEFDRPLKFKIYDHWIVQFQIPGQPEMTVLGCEMRQTRTIRENETMKIGLLVMPWPTSRLMRDRMMPLARYLTKIERGVLQRAS